MKKDENFFWKDQRCDILIALSEIKSMIVDGRFNRIDAYNGVCPPWADYLLCFKPGL